VGPEVNDTTVPLSKLPPQLQALARSWELRNHVAARLDDAGEYIIMKLNHYEPPWVGWSLVNFNA
jgi:hypothetical protein